MVTAPSSVAAGSPFSVTVTAYGTNSAVLTGYRGTVHFTSTDRPPGPCCRPTTRSPRGDDGRPRLQRDPPDRGLADRDRDRPSLPLSTTLRRPSSSPTASTYHPVTPARLVDTRINLGITGKLSANVPPASRCGVDGGVPSGATAVTGNVTVVNETTAGPSSLGRSPPRARRARRSTSRRARSWPTA